MNLSKLTNAELSEYYGRLTKDELKAEIDRLRKVAERLEDTRWGIDDQERVTDPTR